jgi:hypothetical protein
MATAKKIGVFRRKLDFGNTKKNDCFHRVFSRVPKLWIGSTEDNKETHERREGLDGKNKSVHQRRQEIQCSADRIF